MSHPHGLLHLRSSAPLAVLQTVNPRNGTGKGAGGSFDLLITKSCGGRRSDRGGALARHQRGLGHLNFSPGLKHIVSHPSSLIPDVLPEGSEFPTDGLASQMEIVREKLKH